MVGDAAGDEGAGGQPEQVVGQGQGGEGGAVHAVVGQVGHHGARRARGAGGDEHAKADEGQLGQPEWQGEGQRQQGAAPEAIADGQADLAIRSIPAQLVTEHAAQDHAGAAAQHYDGGHHPRPVRVHPVETVQVARHPDDHGAADEQLQAAADVGREHGARGVEGA
ncbi:hypothetical protein D3C72_1423360 [compost metagenome]